MEQEAEKVALHEKIFRDYYGLNWTAFATFSGILLSGLGLTDVLNPAAWTLGALTGLLLAYTLRGYIPDLYINVILISAVVWIAIATALFLPILTNQSIALLIWDGSGISGALGTLFLAIFTSMNLAFCIIAYKKHAIFDPVEIPKNYREHIKGIFEHARVYRKSVSYTVEFYDLGNVNVQAQVKMEYELKNEGKIKERIDITYSGLTNNFKMTSLKVGDKDLTTDANRHKAENNVSFPIEISPGKPLIVSLIAQESYPPEGSDFYMSFLPADGFSLRVKSNNKFTIWGECYCPEEIFREDGTDSIIWRKSGAILPYHGVRLYWRKTI